MRPFFKLSRCNAAFYLNSGGGNSDDTRHKQLPPFSLPAVLNQQFLFCISSLLIGENGTDGGWQNWQT